MAAITKGECIMGDEKKIGLVGAVISGLGGAIGFEVFVLLN